MMKNPAKGIKWDLSDLYDNIKSTKIEKDLELANSQIKSFSEKYKGKFLDRLVPSKLYDYINEYEAIVNILSRLGEYSYLEFAKNKNNEEVISFYQNISEQISDIQSELVWFELQIIDIPHKLMDQLLKDEKLSNTYGYYLQQVRKLKPFVLSEKEERIITLKDQSGVDAFSRLYEEISSNEQFQFEYKGQKEVLDMSSIITIINQDIDREKREAAANCFTETFKANSHLYTYILNTLINDRVIERRIRGFEYPMQSAYLSNDTPKEIVDSLESAVISNWSIGERYYTHKRTVMKLKKLHEWDRYAPINSRDSKNYSWKEAKDIVLSSFYEFDDEYGSIAQKFFDNNWIDAELGKGKSNGAFCTHGTPDLHPYILLNFTGKVRDVMTLAHELGHGIHHYMSKKQKLVNFASSTPVAEIASVFGESLVFDYLLKHSKEEELKSLLANKIEDDMATVMRQMSFHLFEKEINNARKTKGELSTVQVSELWQSQLQQMFGNGLELTSKHEVWWMPVLHFYHFDFYVYSYAFGQLLTLSLYAKYKNDGNKGDFVKKYKGILETGGSTSPVNLLREIEIDISDRNFWSNGMKLLDNYVTEFENI